MAEGTSRTWLAPLRRFWATGTTLDRWIDENGITGVVWTPGGWEPEDAAYALVRLAADGATPDASLLWDLALHDIRAAAASLAHVHRDTDELDGYVAVWLDPEGLVDPGRAAQAARSLLNEIGRENVAAAFAWQGARAGAVSAIVEHSIAVALSGVDSPDAVEGVRRAWDKGMERSRKDAEAEGEDPEELWEPPVFLLRHGGVGAREEGEHRLVILDEGPLRGAGVISETRLVCGRGPAVRLPASPAEEQAERRSAVERIADRASGPVNDDGFAPDAFRDDVRRASASLGQADVLQRMWARDHTLWNPEPHEIADRLGWLDVPEAMAEEIEELRNFAADARSNATEVVLLGMGGSALAAQTLRSVCGGALPLTVLDTTHPGHIRELTDRLDAARTLFVVASKSGTTAETRSQLEHFWSVAGSGERFIAVTDAGTPLAALAGERGFRRVFQNPPDIGGRYSGLSYFGLVPAALCGVDVARVLREAVSMSRAHASCVPGPHAPGVRLGAAIGEAHNDDRDKLTLVLPGSLASFGDWVEQLIAESTGKDGDGILPVSSERLGPPDVYRPDRLFVAYAMGAEPFAPELEALEADHPVVRIRIDGPQRVGAEMYRWMVATAVAGYELDVNPFDQPDVESTKERTWEILEGGGVGAPEPGDVRAALASLNDDGDTAGSYIAIQAFLPPTADNERRLQDARLRLRDRYRVATTVGFGPRFLHSTGQLHKGGIPGVYLQVFEPPETDVEVGGMSSFGRLFAAQADADLRALRDTGRTVARVTLSDLEQLSG